MISPSLCETPVGSHEQQVPAESLLTAVCSGCGKCGTAGGRRSHETDVSSQARIGLESSVTATLDQDWTALTLGPNQVIWDSR